MLQNNLYCINEKQMAESSADFEISLNVDHPIYQGHFPGDPVTPGVCILQIACELFELVAQKKCVISALKNVKFMQVIRPNEVPTVHFHFDWLPVDCGFSVKCLVSNDSVNFSKINCTFSNE